MDLSLTGVMRFLHHFGYLSLPHDLPSDHYPKHDGVPLGKLGVWDGAAREALIHYSIQHKLPFATRPDDDVILAHMNTRRCGHRDNVYGLRAQVMKWRKTDLTFKFINLSPDLPMNHISDSFNRGFGGWAGCTPLTFTEVMANQPADITITFRVIDSPGQVLAQAYFPENGTMEFDESELWSWNIPIARGQVDLTTVVMHEAGHVIGLEHSTVQGAQMAPVYAGPKRFLEADDIRRAQSLYGAKP